MKTLRESLLDYDMAMLRAIAEQLQIPLETNIQKEAVDHLALELSKPEVVGKALALLSSEEREALDNLIRWGGKAQVAFFTRRYGPIRPFGPGKLARERPWENPASPAEKLWFLGMIFKGFEVTETGLVEVVYIPEDLLSLLPSPAPLEETFPVEVAAEPARKSKAEPYLTEALFLYLVYLQKEPVQPVYELELPDAAKEALVEIFKKRKVWPPIWADLLLPCVHSVALSLGLVRVESGFIKPHPDYVRPWLKASQWERLTGIWQAWLDNLNWNELWELPALRCEDTGWRNDPRLARRRIVSFLSRCPEEQWISLDSFVAAIKEVEPDFQRPDGNYNTWYIRDPTTGQYLMGFEHWEQVEGALIRFILTGPLHWIGVMELGWDEGEAPVSFRLSPI
ncbi:MAG TPA: hypothetical protein ENG33_04395, partial [Chloroflexi bacterium]|nr:hypothetical protein [Chloroflexota bacterium]